MHGCEDRGDGALKLIALREARNVRYLLSPPRLPAPPSSTEPAPRVRRTPPSERQFDLWPQRIIVTELDPRAVAGASTRVEAMYTVRYEREPGIHQVFFDHYGWYCADHGPACKAVREVTARRAGDSPS